MTARASGAAAVPPWAGRDGDGSVQLGSALPVHLIPATSPARTAWLRLSVGALIFLAPRSLCSKDLPPGPSCGPIRT
jgi:inner membrane transporter RhtA